MRIDPLKFSQKVPLGGLVALALADHGLLLLYFFFFCITLGLELSDTKVYAPVLSLQVLEGPRALS